MKRIGLDAGSVSVKYVVLDDSGHRISEDYRKHKGHPLEVALEMLSALPGDECAIAVTGSAGRLIAEVMGLEPVNEIVAQSHATMKLHPRIRTVIEMGGEDSKLIQIEDGGVKDFAMNSVCAAGTGSFLDQQGERLRLTPEEMSALALSSPKPPRIAGRCSVFAKSDMIHLQQIATPLEDIVAGLCFAVARNFKGSIVRGRTITAPVAFQGGVAFNRGMVRAFKEVFELDELFVPEGHALMGAWGAALKSIDDGSEARMDLAALEAYIKRERAAATGHKPLRTDGDLFHDRHMKDSRDAVAPMPSDGKVSAYFGIDIGSISTNLVLTDRNGNLLTKRYLMTAGRPIEAVREGMRSIAAEMAGRVDILGVGTTGSGRYMIADYVGADIVKNEITAQATAAAYIDPRVDTIFEIGGQDSKYISLRDGVIVDFEMNKACAAGTGSFLEEQAEKLDISVKGEFAECAFGSACPSRLGERCTVFMENSLMANLQKGVDKDDLLAGLSYSIVQNYINRVVAGRHIGEHIFFQGGVAFNKAVVAAFEKFVGRTVTVPPNHDVTGAIGMALIAMRHMDAMGNPASRFKGFGRAETPYGISSFGCKGCSNLCEINTVKIEGEGRKLFYGGRCEKYDIDRKDTSRIPNLFKFRDDLLWASVREPRGDRPKIGIPYIFFFNDFLPYWSTLLNSLGFDVVLSGRPDRQIVDKGLQAVLSEACFPVKVALGHLKHLRESGVDTVLNPSFINMNNGDGMGMAGLACPHTQSIPYVGKVAVDGMKVLAPVVDLSKGRKHLENELLREFGPLGAGRSKIRAAMLAAETAQHAFDDAVKARGREVLAAMKERAVVIVGRAYNAFERGMNLQIPEKLATLGVLAIPMDMLPLRDMSIEADWPHMYWRSGQRILKAARYIKDHPHLFPVFIGNFSCGPDSFILKDFKDAMDGKPFLHIEIDEHSADAGAITRCEAFLDSITARRDDRPKEEAAPRLAQEFSLKGRKVYIPRMADHAYAIAAAFLRSGIAAEVMAESDEKTLEYGMKYVSGKECYPCLVTTGDMVREALRPGFDPARSAFYMPSGSGPCRFGQYNVFHRNVLRSLGLDNVPVYAPSQEADMYVHYREKMNGDFIRDCWRGIVSYDLLYRCLRQTKPYELAPGEAQALYDKYKALAFDALRLRDVSEIERVLADARREFEAVPVDGSARKPLIGVVGEIFVRTNEFSNESLVNRIEALGGEVWLAPIEEWVQYIGAIGLRKALHKKQYSVMLYSLLKQHVQHRIENRYGRIFKGFLDRIPEPPVTEIFERAAPYVSDTFEGETVLSVGKAVDMAVKGASGIVNAMPFGCMPGTIVTALMRAVSRDYDIPCISVPYDGTESSTTRLQLEAFMDQAGRKARQENMAKAGR